MICLAEAGFEAHLLETAGFDVLQAACNGACASDQQHVRSSCNHGICPWMGG